MIYEFEDIREFFVRRTWFRDNGWLITSNEYNDLKERNLVFDEPRAAYLRAFRDGWLAAKS